MILSKMDLIGPSVNLNLSDSMSFRNDDEPLGPFDSSSKL